jgi:shikimate kinase
LKRHVVLVGLPGSGKTIVGRELASRLGVPHSDVDLIIERRAGRSIPEIFRLDGEVAFRRLEREIVDELLGEPPHVISPGGGWVMGVGDLGSLNFAALVVFLEVEPGAAVQRLGGSGGRPLLEPDPLAAMARLLGARNPIYRTAEAAVNTTNATVAAVADRVLGLARIRAGW